MMLKRAYINLLFVLAALSASAQGDHFNNAYKSFETGNLEQAKAYIDSAVTGIKSAEGQAWYLRGFIYKEIYKKLEKGNPLSPVREESLRSFIRALELSTDPEDITQNKANIQYLAASYYNDAAAGLTPEGYRTAAENYEKYKSAVRIVDAASDFRAKDIEFKLALASLFTKMYEADNKNDSLFNKTRQLYADILAIDPDNLSANYNLGILYYNKAVNIINALDYDMDMVALMEVQEQCVEIFKQSLPYMEKAYQLNPKRRETLVGLSGIYFSLNEFEKSNTIKAEIENLDK